MIQVKKLLLRLLPSCLWPYKKKYADISEIINNTEHLSKSEIQEWQLIQLKALINYVWENSKGYREHWERGGFFPQQLQTLEDINKVPIITKETLRDNIDLFSIKRNSDIFKVATGGSTGIPFSFYNSKELRAIESSFIDNIWSQFYKGLTRKSLRTIIRGGVIKNGQTYDPLFGLRLSSRNVTPEMVKAFIKSIDIYKPPIMHVYPSSLYVISKIMLDNQIERSKHIFKVICFGSEPLYQFQLDKINLVFKEPKSLLYGSTEKVVLAANCSKSDMYHIYPQYGLTEILKSDGTKAEIGETGEIVGTSFWGLETPFIRYKTGDMALVGEPQCNACGREYQLLQRIEGRIQEFVVDNDKKMLSMTYIAGCIHDDIFEPIQQFRFKQTQIGIVEFLYVRKKDKTTNIDDIMKRLNITFGPSYELIPKEVEVIPLTKAGKMSFLEQALNIQDYL